MFKQDTRKAEVSLNLFLPPGTNRSRVWQKCGWLIDSKNNSRSRYLSQAILRFHVNLSSLQSVIRVLSQIHRLRLKYYRRIACNGKFLCEKIKSVVNDSAGNLYAYNSGCRCAKPWLKITLFNKRVLIILYWFGFVTLNKVIAANYLMSLLNLNSSDYLYSKSVWYTLIMLTNLWQ